MTTADFIEKIALAAFGLLPGVAQARLKQHRVAIRVRAAIRRWRWNNSAFGDVYDENYFDSVEQTSSRSADVMAASIVKHFSPRSVMDVGCGTGVLMHALGLLGIEVQGIEHAPAALKHCRDRMLDVTDIDLADAQEREQVSGRADLAICMEVAHQLPASAANGLLQMLCRVSDTILFSSPSDAEDRRPLNSQPRSYWITRFGQHGYAVDEELTSQIGLEWEQGRTAPWFYTNVLVLRRAG